MDRQAIKERFQLLGDDTQLMHAVDTARQVAATDVTVIIYGESGTGKEIFSKIIHQLSHRKHKTFVAVNCGAIPEGTIDSELFGHEKGAFTGAHEARKGYFETANGGTIFLDEISEMPPSTQSRLLRILESGEFIRVGSSAVQKTDVRIIAATNIDLMEAVRKNKFRQDLFYRLNTVPLYIPPLRERGNDIVKLFDYFSLDCARKYNQPAIKLGEDAKEILLNYHWQGNVRELRNLVEQIFILEKNKMLNTEILQKYIPKNNSVKLPVPYTGREPEISERELLYKILFELRKDVNELKNVLYSGTQIPETANYEGGQNFSIPSSPRISSLRSGGEDKIQSADYVEENLSLAENEKGVIVRALQKHKGIRRKAARDLGISERTLYRKINDYNLNL